MTRSDKPEKQVTAVGVVIPVDWDDAGAPVAFAVATYREQEYLIDGGTGAGRELMQLLHEKIRVTGELGPFVNNRRLITVSSYERVR